MSSAGQIVGTFIGGVIGFAVGGPAGAAKGAALGYSLTRSRESQSPTYQFGKNYNTRSQNLPVPVVYGKNQMAGNDIFEDVSGDDDEKIFIQVAVSEGPIKSISSIKANEVNIDSKSEVRLGERTQTANTKNKYNQTFPYTAYISADLEAGENISGNPTITSIVEGRKIEVWNGSSWVTEYSQNPAYCLLDFLTNSRYGLDIDKKNIDLYSFASVGEYCDEEVDGEPRFQLDYVLDAKKSSLDYIQEMLATFRGMLLYSAGELRLKVDAPEAPVQSFTMDNIVADSFQYSKTSKDERYNQVIIKYTDPDQNWAVVGAKYSDDSSINDKGVVEEEFELLGINRFSQAGRQARFFQKKSKYCPTFASWKAGIDSLHCEVGDVVTISHDVSGWTDKEFRILEIAEEENDEMRITAQEYNEAIYSDDGVVEQIPDDSNLPNPFEPPKSVLNLSATEIVEELKDGTILSKIQVIFDKPNDGKIFWKYGNIHYRKYDESTSSYGEWVYDGKTEETSYILGPIDSAGDYQIKVVSENKNNIKQKFDEANLVEITINGKTEKPDEIDFKKIEWLADRIIVTWDYNGEDKVEVRTNDDFGAENDI